MMSGEHDLITSVNTVLCSSFKFALQTVYLIMIVEQHSPLGDYQEVQVGLSTISINVNK